ncbi:MAG: hypothetical protein MMC23_004940 [Stictis urceolatum]|nr:hypothetical protein [Stictis urceolata]
MASKYTSQFIALPLITCAALCSCREIVFPKPGALQYAFQSSNSLEDIDVSGNKFNGLTTFANLPYVDCFANSDVETKFDIAFLGAQFDTGVTARPGARFGPVGIRLGSRRVHPQFYFDVTTGEMNCSMKSPLPAANLIFVAQGNNPFDEWANIVDCGDPLLTFLDNTVALKQLEKAHKVVAARKPNATSSTLAPRIITLGGDHTTTLAALRSTHKVWGKVAVVHFDSHIDAANEKSDTWDPKVIGGGLSEYAGVNHGTFLHIAHEEGLISNASIHAGIRAPVSRPKGDRRNDLRCGFEVVRAGDLDRIGVQGIINRIKDRVQDSRVYISVDIDVLDPAYAPGTGTAEVGGWTTRELLSILEGLQGFQVIGADVVEVSPAYDNAGETTTLAATEVALRLMQLMVGSPMNSQEVTAN